MNIKGLFFLVEGIVLGCAGIFCLLHPVFATMSIVYFITAIILLNGIFQVIRAFLFRKNKKVFYSSIVSAFFAFVVAFIVFKYSQQSVLLLTSILIAYLCFEGILKTLFFSFVKHSKFGKKGFIGGVTSLIFAFILMLTLPVSAMYAMGALLGGFLVGYSISIFMLGVDTMKNTDENSLIR